MALRVLFLGENWYGSCARACCYALRRLGCDVMDIDVQTIFPQLRRLSSRAVRRLFKGRFVREYNELILGAASSCEPDVVLAFKGQYVKAQTLRSLRERGVRLYNYYPDTSAFAHDRELEESLPGYDCVFYTKRFWDRDVRGRIGLRHAEFLPHGYDSEVHYPVELDARDVRQYGHDVIVIATHTRHKEDLLDGLVALMPAVHLRIWGGLWRENCRSSRLGGYIEGTTLVGTGYARALRAARINIAVMSGIVRGASQGDETTTRTYEIPACGGFMLHERTEEVLGLFEEGKEIACFGSVQELAEKIEQYLAHPDERQAIARRGHARCVPAYSYDNRMAEIVRWHTGRDRGD